jgi:uncharacterized protein YbbC (DUF1343 family)
MVRTGLEIISGNFPRELRGKRIGVLCHAPSITRDFRHITDILRDNGDCRLTAVFGPQHGIYGQTQDNMIEWEGGTQPGTGIPVFSLYGRARKPTREMLSNIDVLIADLQDVGARLYTYVWTVKHCMEACAEAGIPVWILDRPNPIGKVPYDGPVLKEEFFTFVGGASIPMCHRMTIGEISMWVREKHIRKCNLKVVWMEGWQRDSLFSGTRLPWVLPSPNMPTLKTAIVYPGIVLFEALNISEGRGTTIPFELFGAPFLDADRLLKRLEGKKLPGCRFRRHDFIPVFNKYRNELCHGIQIHVTDPGHFRPVRSAMEIIDSIMETSPAGSVKFMPPPYEYEEHMMPFDILSGDSGMREALLSRKDPMTEFERWKEEIAEFEREFREISAYPYSKRPSSRSKSRIAD